MVQDAYKRLINDGHDLVPVGDIKTHPRNPRRGDLAAVSESIRVNGFYGACVVNRRTKRILAGNHRYIAARDLGYTEVPVVWVDVGEPEEMRILAADNRTSDLGGYDDAVLASLLSALNEDVGLIGTGYQEDDLSSLLSSITADFEPLCEQDARLDQIADKRCPHCGGSI